MPGGSARTHGHATAVASPKPRRGRAALRLAALLASACLLAATAAAAGEPAGPAPGGAAAPGQVRPISAAKSQLGDLLRKWFAEGTAAGNDADWYDNRDRGHSHLDLGLYPQLRKVDYTDAERNRNIDYALQGRVLPLVVFGNSSTSAAVAAGGSNPRRAYSMPAGLAMLYAQYTHNNLYVYPSHMDHNVGHNGAGGYGDLYPTNTPCVIISQGSSGTDRPFMEAVASTLAAFRPEVKRRLVEAGLLMPTVQMILRRTNPQAPTLQDYLTGKAHPTVFEGFRVSDLKMAEMAHAIEADAIPPMVQLRAVEESRPVRGRDFFDLADSERLGDTPAVIARVFRGRDRDRRIVVSAEASFDLNKRPLTYHWVVLRGDASRIRLKALNEAGSVCEVTVSWHERRPVARGSALESNRIDIGVFVRNGVYYSAPGFLTFLCLDDEARAYDAGGRALEIGYGLGAVQVSVADWSALLGLLKADADSPGARLLKKALQAQEIPVILKAADEYRSAQAAADAAQQGVRQADATRQGAAEDRKAAERRRDEARVAAEKSPGPDAAAALRQAEADCARAVATDQAAEADAAAARKTADAAVKAAGDCLGQKRNGLKVPVNTLLTGALSTMAADPDLCLRSAAAIEAAVKSDDGRKAALDAARKRLAGFGLLKDQPGPAVELKPISEGPAPAALRLTRFEQALLERFNGEVLGRAVFAGIVTFSYEPNYVDPRIAASKSWRDVYQYNAKGECVGWTRYDGQAATEFNQWGLVVVARDALGRCLKGQAVRYEPASPAANPPARSGVALRWVLEPGTTEYEYADDNDWRGRLKMPAGAP